MSQNRRMGFFMVAAAAVSISGCGGKSPEFSANRMYVHRLERESRVEIDTLIPESQSALEYLFGTPDSPKWPSFFDGDSEISNLVSVSQIERAAGAVGRAKDKVERGLYRKHCAQCHGITGDGLGPAAGVQNPYPRDFRRGSFKFKSTPMGVKPTHEDLKKTIENGLAGTAMPAFRTLTASKYYVGDVEALVHYVRYLSIRGEVERKLLELAAREIELEKGEHLFDATIDGSVSDSHRQQLNRIEKVTRDVVASWVVASSRTTSVVPNASLKFAWPSDLTSDRSTELNASVARGGELFRSQVSGCSNCHGADGKGDGKTQGFDEWTKDWTIRMGIDPASKTEWRTVRHLGGMSPMIDSPRNLHLGVLRGGHEPEEVYMRIVNGIEGTPMPAAAREPDVVSGMTNDQIWDLVNFVLSLGYSGGQGT